MQRLYLEGGVALNGFFTDLFYADDTLAGLVISADELATGGIFAEDDVIAVENGKWLIADKCFGTGDGVAETSRLFLADVGDVCKVRKVHNVILLPSLEAAEKLALRLERIGNLQADGRPILGLSSHDLLELTLESCPQAVFLPAHIWTPHFSLFGAFSGFDSLEECFGDLAPYVRAVETGLSSDPPMNGRVPQLDALQLVSHSDAHSPQKLGREADVLKTELSYPAVKRALETGDGLWGTVEFFPQEGKYHWDGHRNCGVCLSPREAKALENLCPVCGKPLTIGVEHRVEDLARRQPGEGPAGAKPFVRLAPLATVLAARLGKGEQTKTVQGVYEALLAQLGPEFTVLRQTPAEAIASLAGDAAALGVELLRQGKVAWRPGFDGEYGKLSFPGA